MAGDSPQLRATPISKEEKRERFKEGFGKVARALVGVGLPILGNAVAGPMGGAAASRIAKALGLGADASPDEIEAVIAEADPSALVELRRIEAETTIAEHERFTAEHDGLTRRHEADAKSDSPLARNIRPVILAALTVAYLLLLFLVAIIFDGERQAAGQQIIEGMSPLLMVVFGYYFGSRGVEKSIAIYKGGAA